MRRRNGKSETCRASEWQSHWVNSRALNLAVDECMRADEILSPLSLKQDRKNPKPDPDCQDFTGLDFRTLLVSLVGAVVFNDRLSRAASPETVRWYKVTTRG